MRAKGIYMLLVAGLAGSFLLAACGSGQNTATDSTGIMSTDSSVIMSDTGTVRDTAPAAEQPPGAINPGEDSARFGTGMGDSAKKRRGD